MKRRNPAFIILIFLFWYYSTIRERKKPLLQDVFHKVRVTNLTQGGLKAMEEMGQLNGHSQIASKDMCTFLILNVSSFQLIPVNMIAYRSQYGSANPASILGPAMIATFFSTLAGVVFAKFMYALPQTRKHARNPKLPPKEIPSTYSRSQADLSKKKKGGIFH